MSEVEQTNKPNPGSKGSGKVKWIVVGLLLLFSAIIVMNLPHGFSDDLSRIGKGKPALVLVRDKNAVQSFDLMEVLNSLRDQYEGKIEFLLTDSNTPEGRAFIAEKGGARATLVMLDSNGNMVKVLYPPQTKESVQQEIAAVIGEGK